ncbi:MAG TPA: hypothetical protein VM911_03015, partial [Pyrinomonadaceae bacterium]|nr:hypothetical protein [Pyrinomonadaceae bacterium]
MSSRNSGKIILSFLGALVFLALMGFSQGQERMIDKISWQTEPVQLRKLKTKGKPIELGKKFLEQDDWLRGLSVNAVNISDKSISRIEIELSFPRTERASEELPVYVVAMIYGQEPSSDDETQKQLLPGENTDVKLLEVNLPFINSALESLGYPAKITHAQVMLSSVTFNDGTTWSADKILYTDPSNPHQKMIRPIPEKFRTSGQSSLSSKSAVFGFQKASFRRLVAPPLSSSSRASFGKFWARSSRSMALSCNTVYLGDETHNCSTAGCSYTTDLYDDNIELLGIRDARKQLSSVQCKQSNGTLCSSNTISN